MKKIILIILFFSSALAGIAQSTLTYDNIVGRKTIKLGTNVIEGFQLDTNFVSNKKVPSALQIKNFVEGRVGSDPLKLNISDTVTGYTTLFKNTKNIKYLDTSFNATINVNLFDDYGTGILYDQLNIMYDPTYKSIYEVGQDVLHSAPTSELKLSSAIGSNYLSTDKRYSKPYGLDTIFIKLGTPNNLITDYYIEISTGVYELPIGSSGVIKDLYTGITSPINTINGASGVILIGNIPFTMDPGIPATYGTRFLLIINVIEPMFNSTFQMNRNLNLKGPLKLNNLTGSSGQVLTSQGSNSLPIWTTPSASGTTETASQGLTKYGNDIQLGGTLSSTAILNTSTSDLYVYGSNPSSVAIFYNEANGMGLAVGAVNNYGMTISTSRPSNSSVAPGLDVYRTSAGTPANGIGVSIDLRVASGGGSYIANTLVSKWTDATTVSRTSQFDLTGVSNAVTQTFANFQTGGIVRVNNLTDTLATKAYARSLGSGGTTYTASNGANKVGNDIQLGGSLTSNISIDGGTSYQSSFLSGNNNTVAISNSRSSNGNALNVSSGTGTNNNGLYIQATGGSSTKAIYAAAYSGGDGIYSESSSGTGIKGSSTTGIGGWFTSGSTQTNSIIPSLRVEAVSSNTTANGFGVSSDFYLHSNTGVSSLANRLISKWSTATHASRTSQFDLIGVNSAVSETFANFQTGGIVRVNNLADTLATKAYARSLSSAGSGTVTGFIFLNNNGFSGVVTNPGTLPTLDLGTSVTGMIKGNGTAISAAIAGTDYVVPSQVVNIPKWDSAYKAFSYSGDTTFKYRVNGLIDTVVDSRKLVVTNTGSGNATINASSDTLNIPTASSVFTTTGSDAYYNLSGNLGLGVTSPVTKLDLLGAIKIRPSSILEDVFWVTKADGTQKAFNGRWNESNSTFTLSGGDPGGFGGGQIDFNPSGVNVKSPLTASAGTIMQPSYNGGTSLELRRYSSGQTGAIMKVNDDYTGDGIYFRISSSGQVSIGNDAPNAALIFDVKSTTKASSPYPLMTSAQRTAITTPPIGAHVYQTDGTEGVYVYKSSGWVFAY